MSITEQNTLIPYFTAYLIALFHIVILIHHPEIIIFTTKKLRATAPKTDCIFHISMEKYVVWKKWAKNNTLILNKC